MGKRRYRKRRKRDRGKPYIRKNKFGGGRRPYLRNNKVYFSEGRKKVKEEMVYLEQIFRQHYL